jgi:hypothetical protein
VSLAEKKRAHINRVDISSGEKANNWRQINETRTFRGFGKNSLLNNDFVQKELCAELDIDSIKQNFNSVNSKIKRLLPKTLRKPVNPHRS